MKVKVELKTGQIIEVLLAEVTGLRKAGLLKESKEPAKTKEEKNTGRTKEEKHVGKTKRIKSTDRAKTNKPVQRRSANWYPGPGETKEPPPVPVTISSKNIHGSSPKNV